MIVRRLGSHAADVALAAVVRMLAPLLIATRVRIYQANIHRIGDALIDIGFLRPAP